MRAVVQRVAHAEVRVEGAVVGSIGAGLCVFVGVGLDDALEDASWLAGKVARARLFRDDADKMNLDVSAVGGAVLAVSQFTLFGDLRKGNRPSFNLALEPGRARELFESFCAELRALALRVETGRFREHMEVSLQNDGPVTVLLDSKRAF